MIRGVVTSQREAVIQLSVAGLDLEEVVEAVIDTGFNDFLSLPPALIEALDAFANFDSARSEKVRVAMEPLAEQARNLDDEFTELVEVQPIRARAYVNLIAISQGLERIAYAIENIAEETIYVSEARDVRHPRNTLEVD